MAPRKDWDEQNFAGKTAQVIRGMNAIFKQYKFPTFLEAIAFIDRVADAAEDVNHHPDLENHYNRVRVALHTWDESAVTEKDLALAHRIEAASVVDAGY